MIRNTESELLGFENAYKAHVQAIKNSDRDATDSEKKWLDDMKETISSAKAELKGLRQNYQEQVQSGTFMTGLAQGMQGLMGAYTAASGILAQFNADEEKLQKIQTKLQSSMAILMGLQQVSNTLMSTSAFRVQVVAKATNALAAAQAKLAAASGLAKIAMGGFVAIAAVAVGALAAILLNTNKVTAESNKMTKAITNNASSQIFAYQKLRAQWVGANGDIEKQNKLLKDDAWKELGVAVNNVADAEKVLIDNTEAMVKSYIAKAKAAAMYEEAQNPIKRATQKEVKAAKFEAKANGERPLNAWDKTMGYLFGNGFWNYTEQYYDENGNLVTSGTRPNLYGNNREQKKQNTIWNTKMYYKHRADKKNTSAKKAYDEAYGYLAEAVDYDAEAQKILEDAGITDNDTQDIINAMRQRAEAVKNARLALDNEVRSIRNEIVSNEIELIQDNHEKEIKANELELQKRLQAIEDEKKQYIDALKAKAKAEWLAANPGASDSDWNGSGYKPDSEQQKFIDETFGPNGTLAAQARAQAQKKSSEIERSYQQEMLRNYGDYAQKRLALVMEWDKKIEQIEDKSLARRAEKQKEVAIAELEYEQVSQYGSYSTKRDALSRLWDARIETLETADEKINAAKQKERELFDLAQQYESSYQMIFSDPATLAKKDLATALDLAKQKFREMSQAADPESYAAMRDQIKALSEELDSIGNGQDIWGKFGGLVTAGNRRGRTALGVNEAYQEYEKVKQLYYQHKATIDDVSAALNVYNAASREANKAQQDYRDEMAKLTFGELINLPGLLTSAADRMREFADAMDDADLAARADEMGAFAQNLSSAAQGFQSGGWIGAIAGGVLDIVSQTASALMAAKSEAKEMADNAMDFQRAMELAALSIDSIKTSSIFGDDNARRATEAWRIAGDAMKKYSDEMAAYNEAAEVTVKRTGNTNYGKGLFFGLWDSGSKASGLWLQQIDAVEKGYNKLQAMAIKTKDATGWGRFWGAEDTYTSLKDLAPQLWDAEGKLQTEQLRIFLETNTQLDETQRKELENLLDIQEAYEDAMDAVKDYASGILGDFAFTIGDVICDAILTGEDAMEQLGGIGASVIDTLARQMASSWMLENYLNQYEEQMTAAFGSGSAKDVTDVVAQIVRGLPAAVQGVTEMVSGIYDYAETVGLDIDSLKESTREAATKNSLGASQESVDESNGRLTAIQGLADDIRTEQKVQTSLLSALRADSSSILEEVMGIHADTTGIRLTANEMRTFLKEIRSNVGTIADKGVRML